MNYTQIQSPNKGSCGWSIGFGTRPPNSTLAAPNNKSYIYVCGCEGGFNGGWKYQITKQYIIKEGETSSKTESQILAQLHCIATQ
jgi:hypothetical protein